MMPPEAQPDSNGTTPLISLIIACRNVGGYIDAALASARGQTLRDLEILVIDDGSTDDTPTRIDQHAASDPRIRRFKGPASGPAAARNIGLAAARGTWIAILDGDDIMHPRRFEWLLAAPAARTADILAENQIQFYEDGSASRFLIDGPAWQQERRVDLPLYIDSNRMFGTGPQLGYLKPLIRRSRLVEGGICYDESLRIGEDYDLIARLLLAGAAFIFLPAAYYFYRRHSASISFRLGAADLDQLIAAADGFQARLTGDAAAQTASRARRASLIKARNFADLVARLKARQIPAAAWQLLRQPGLMPLLWDAVQSGVTRRLRDRRKTATTGTMTATGRTCSVLWRGDTVSAGPLLDWLRGQGWQPQLHRCDDALCHLEANRAQPQLPDMVRQRGDELLLCNDQRLIDCFSYLLAPGARCGLVTTEARDRTTATAPGLDLYIDDGPNGFQQREVAMALSRQPA